MANGWLPRTGEEWFRQMESRMREQERSAGARNGYGGEPDALDVVDASIWPGEVGADTVSAPVIEDIVLTESPEEPVVGDPVPGELEVGVFTGDPYEYDVVAPRAPSAPVVTTRLGTHEVYWDGLAEESVEMDLDFSYLEVHRSEVPDFEFSDQSFYSRLTGAGSVIVTGMAYNTSWYYRFIAVDDTGNRSEPSYATGPVTVTQLVNTDVAPASIEAGHIAANAITADKIAVGALLASKIGTGELAAGVRIIAGPEFGTHAEVTSTGFRAYVEDPVDGIPNEAIRMGTDTGDLFALFDVTGLVKASIADTGLGSFTGLNVDNDPTVQGIPLIGKMGNTLPDVVDFAQDPVNYDRDYETDPIGIIEQYAKGNVAWYQDAGTAYTNSIVSGQEMALFELGFDCEPGRQYSFDVSPILFNISGTAGNMGLRVRFTSDGTSPSLSSNAFAFDYHYAAAPFASCQVGQRLFNGGAVTQTQLRVLVCVYSANPTVSVYDIQSVTATIKDMGPTKTITGDVRTYKTGGTTGGGATVKRTYTKTYASTSAATYKGNGTKRTDTTDVVQGYNSANGDGEGLWIFPSTIASDLTGATVNKVEVYAYANHWYYNSGGTALVKVHGYTSAPASSPSQTTAKTVSGWPKPGGKWVTLPSSLYAGFKSGTYRGFGMGPSGGTNLLYYGRFNGGTTARIRVTYTK